MAKKPRTLSLGEILLQPHDLKGLLAHRASPGGLLSEHQPSLRELIGNAIYDAANKMGMKSQAQRMRSDATAAVDFVPGVGDAVGLNDAANDFGAGNYGMAAAGLGLTAAGMVPVVGDVAAGAAKKGIKAYHGSPHSFDKFDMSKIGTGEGAQVYGHGLYFAESEGVAESYRDNLSRQVTFRGKPLGTHPMDSDVETAKHSIASVVSNGEDPRGAIINQANEWRTAAQNYGRYAYDKSLPQATRDAAAQQAASFNKIADEIEKFDPADFAKNPGSMYEVNINADPDDFLDWDKPLSEQGETVRSAFPGLGQHVSGQGLNTQARIEGAGGQEGATDWLKQKGIPGIKYLDQGSRGAGNGSRNYVVFDDKLINIVRTYGLAGAVAAGLISQGMADQMAAQGIGT